jgi:hypothetical protein
VVVVGGCCCKGTRHQHCLFGGYGIGWGMRCEQGTTIGMPSIAAAASATKGGSRVHKEVSWIGDEVNVMVMREGREGRVEGMK